MADQPTVKCSITVIRKFSVEVDEDTLRDLVRKAVGAPETADVSLSEYDGAFVSWSEQEVSDG